MIAITGATGQLGQLVIKKLISKVAAKDIVAVARNPDKASNLAAEGIKVRQADYSNPNGWDEALEGVEKLLLISSSEIGHRVEQHKTVIDAAKNAGLKLIVYTSILRADTNKMSLAPEHIETEKLIKESGIPYIFLRNGWYTENYTAAIPAALEHGTLLGAAGEGKISSATREDYAEAAATVLTSNNIERQVFELAGDTAYTLSELAAEISLQSGKDIPFMNLEEKAYADVLLKAGLPEMFAGALAAWDIDASRGELFAENSDLSKLIGRPSTSLKDAVKAALVSNS